MIPLKDGSMTVLFIINTASYVTLIFCKYLVCMCRCLIGVFSCFGVKCVTCECEAGPWNMENLRERFGKRTKEKKGKTSEWDSQTEEKNMLLRETLFSVSCSTCPLLCLLTHAWFDGEGKEQIILTCVPSSHLYPAEIFFLYASLTPPHPSFIILLPMLPY